MHKTLKEAWQKSCTTKPVTLHWLRHRLATHLLESGTELRFNQKLFGHGHTVATEIYTQISTHSLQKLKVH